jgi:hypothetical protein
MPPCVRSVFMENNPAKGAGRGTRTKLSAMAPCVPRAFKKTWDQPLNPQTPATAQFPQSGVRALHT